MPSRPTTIFAFLLVSTLASGAPHAATDPLIEEIVVSAQRVEESAQKVPMSLSAFTDAMIEDRQIVGLLDVQLNSPNVSATDGNYADREFSIRGLGNLLDTQGRTQQSVSYHINEVPLAPPRAYGVSVRWNFGG